VLVELAGAKGEVLQQAALPSALDLSQAHLELTQQAVVTVNNAGSKICTAALAGVLRSLCSVSFSSCCRCLRGRAGKGEGRNGAQYLEAVPACMAYYAGNSSGGPACSGPPKDSGVRCMLGHALANGRTVAGCPVLNAVSQG
jgi:hypothetical protein